MKNISDRLHQLRALIATTAETCDREPDSISLLAVSKTQGIEAIRAAAAEGQMDFGENFVQEAIDKIGQCSDLNLIWHFIGRIQSNKTAVIASHFDWVHSLDQLRIARRLNEARPENLSPLNICIQINISGEDSKSGILPTELLDFVTSLAEFPRLRLRGLMTLPAPCNGFEQQRLPFQKLHQYFQFLRTRGYALDTLSMGTTNDMTAAITEGATIVRIGTALFGSREKKQ